MAKLDHVHDDDCRRIIGQHPNAAVAWFLMASYQYYVDDTPILSDKAFDELAGFLADRWAGIRHPHKHLIAAEDLTAGTGFAIARERYPAIVISAAQRILADGVMPLPAQALTPPRQLTLL